MSAARIIRRNSQYKELEAKSKLNRTAHRRVGHYWKRYQETKGDPAKRRIAQRYLELYRIGIKNRKRK